MGWNKQSNNNKLLPPGFVIGIVWIIILGLLGFTFYLTYPTQSAWIVILSIIYCLAYPFLTSGLRQEKSSIYNSIALVIATIVSISVFMQNRIHALYTLPFLLWTAYVVIITNI